MPKLIFDIETIGEDWDNLDKTTQENLTRWLKRETVSEEEFEKGVEDIKNGLGFSPLTGEIVAIGVLDYETNKGAVYYQAPDQNYQDFEENGIVFRAMTEKQMLENFWQGILEYNEFISFNGRCFDVPFLMIRSAVHEVKPSKDLMSNRYLNNQKFNALHIDLMDQLSFYGAVRRKGSLHLFCRALGLQSPKDGGVTGDEVQPLFKAKEYQKIARYNVGDLSATRDLYEKWDKYINIK
ncbi:MAG: hypothetical protein GF365_01845 [Candidatus Buchananbacteria bacterium]|nr:hypothetical protein [Candidatus Buchananbacteria bacterium]